ncbi:MAG: DUF2383 domain-containing protein [Deltaproteobacteria bacterium]|nr:DUF2383 domain-containing protein [Deltaproteobacteria bacterium]
MAKKSSVDQLNSFLRGEISAVETYRLALEKLDPGSPARAEVSACMASHEDRVDMLREAIIAVGGEPATGSGTWGAFAKVVEGGARLLGDRAAVAALEEGEDHGLKDYRSDINDLDDQSRILISNRLLPLQQQTHDRMSSLKKRLAAERSS